MSETKKVIKKLNPQETRIAKLVAQGCTNTEIAAQLNKKEYEIRNYVYRITKKMNLRTRWELIVYVFNVIDPHFSSLLDEVGELTSIPYKVNEVYFVRSKKTKLVKPKQLSFEEVLVQQ